MVVELEKAVEIFRDLARIPSLTFAHLTQATGDVTTYDVTSTWSQRDLERAEKITSRRHNVIKVKDDSIDSILQTPQQEIANELFNIQSPSGKYAAIVRKIKNKKGEDKQYIEVWRDGYKWRNIDAESSEKHGKIYEQDNQFGTLRWSHNEQYLVYIAEKKIPKGKSYFEKDSKDKEDKSARGDEFLFKDDWGELLVSKIDPVVCTLDIESETITVLEVDDQLSCGTPLWTKKDESVIFAAWNRDPYPLGLIYCGQRKSGIYRYSLDRKQYRKLSQEDAGVFSPVLSVDGSAVYWIQMNEGGPHCQTCKLMKCDLGTEQVSVVVDVVNEYVPSAVSNDKFPGWYALTLPKRCWSQDGRRLILDNPWRFKSEVIAVDVAIGSVSRLTNDPNTGFITVLDVWNDLILASCSSPIESDHLLIAKLPPDGAAISWTRISSESFKFPDHQYKVQLHQIAANRLSGEFPKVTEFESLLVMPSYVSVDNQIPLILYPHGGPHSRSNINFITSIVGFVKCGFAVLLVNFRGSLGYGQDFVWSLPGFVGEIDVKDCMQALEETVTSGLFDTDRLCIAGGSHGGFLTGCMIGMYPDKFKSAVALNPVLNMSSMYHVTDIPDWVHTEVLKKTNDKFDFSFVPGPSDYQALWEKSPIKYVNDVKTPLLILVGKVDRRVPCIQGQEFHRQLLARNIPTRLLLYPESSHPLREVNVEADVFVNMFQWFRKFVA